MSFKRVFPIMLPTNREAGLALELRRENVSVPNMKPAN
jgi:hypothetical protein